MSGMKRVYQAFDTQRQEARSEWRCIQRLGRAIWGATPGVVYRPEKRKIWWDDGDVAKTEKR